tara:strand:+ start:4242 stop:4343 length:102 start_codon:yes stop_codon:yes gene_type:complete
MNKNDYDMADIALGVIALGVLTWVLGSALISLL